MRRGFTALAIAVIIAAAHFPVLFLGRTAVLRDALRFTLPSREFLGQNLAAGRIPEWCDGVGFGAPFAADPVHGVTYPLTAIVAALPSALGVDLFTLLHLLFAGLGAAAFARRLGADRVGAVLGGGTLVTCGYVSSSLVNGIAPLIAWTPWVAWAADRFAGAAGPTGSVGPSASARSAATPAPASARSAATPAPASARSAATPAPASARSAATPPLAPTPARRVPHSGRMSFPAGPNAANGAVLAGLFALQLLPGEPIAILTALMLAVFVVQARAPRRASALFRLAPSLTAGLPLAAVSLVPAMRVLATSARSAGLDDQPGRWSMYPARILEWAWPMAFGSERHDGFFAGLRLARMPGDACWATSLFLGVPVLLLIAAAIVNQAGKPAPSGRTRTAAAPAPAPASSERANRRLLAASVLFVVLALGSFTPFFGPLRAVFPPLRWCHFPEKWIYGALVLWSSLAGVGFTRVFAAHPPRRLMMMAAGSAAAILAGIVVFQLGAPALAGRLAMQAQAWKVPVNIAAGLDAARWGGIIAFLGTGGFAAALVWRRRTSRWAAPALGATAVLAPLVVTHWLATPLASRRTITPVPDLLRVLDRPGASTGAPRPRVFRRDPDRFEHWLPDGEAMARGVHQTLDTNVATRFGADVLPGFEPAESARVNRFWTEVFPRLSPVAFARLTGVEAVAIQDPAPLANVWPVAAQLPDGWTLLRTQAVRPRAFIAPRWRVAGPDAALAGLAAPGRDLDLGAITVTDADPALRQSEGPLEPCTVQRLGPNHVALACSTAAGGYAVLLEEAAPGWTATVDGRNAPITLADGLFRAVAVGAGAHRVEFTYHTPGLRLGAIVSLLSWIAGAVVLAAARRAPPATA